MDTYFERRRKIFNKEDVKYHTLKGPNGFIAFIPDGVEIIKEGTFSDFYNLKRVILPNSIKVIEKRAFSFCAELEEINMPECLSLEKVDSQSQ